MSALILSFDKFSIFTIIFSIRNKKKRYSDPLLKSIVKARIRHYNVCTGGIPLYRQGIKKARKNGRDDFSRLVYFNFSRGQIYGVFLICQEFFEKIFHWGHVNGQQTTDNRR